MHNFLYELEEKFWFPHIKWTQNAASTRRMRALCLKPIGPFQTQTATVLCWVFVDVTHQKDIFPVFYLMSWKQLTSKCSSNVLERGLYFYHMKCVKLCYYN